MEKIKQTKSIEMEGDEKEVRIKVNVKPSENPRDLNILLNEIIIPTRSVFQVKRGLESYIQRFYRKQLKK